MLVYFGISTCIHVQKVLRSHDLICGSYQHCEEAESSYHHFTNEQSKTLRACDQRRSQLESIRAGVEPELQIPPRRLNDYGVFLCPELGRHSLRSYF